MASFIIAVSRDSQYYFNLKASNGEKILTSEMYTSKQGCQNGIASVRVNSQISDHYKKWKSADNQRYFTLVGANGEVIGTSEMYTTPEARDNGIKSVVRNAPLAEIV